ncbi:hypothetical protein J2792_002495 [Novosphingobium capsulatum]|uniref:Uncharacterized protein n=1 Tax=Novosphingobium capsulatum TaxID=13688 RepID=A0ABU1MMR5_9SPHN|nr:hypothetical protein [Novosphingobium capsulatum]MDR6511619.1 hypothetical protein [Novosphingobium capsulatum]
MKTPPSIHSLCPVTNAAAGLAKNGTGPATTDDMTDPACFPFDR